MEGKGSRKSKNTLCIGLMNKVLIYVDMQKIDKQVLGICILYRNDEEAITHLFTKCLYSKQLLIEADKFIGIKEGWMGEYIE